jgi:hypothetical protein
VYIIQSNQTKPNQTKRVKKQLETTALFKTFNIALLCMLDLHSHVDFVTAGSLRATVRSTVQQENSALRDATAFQDTETLKLTDDDNIAFFRDELEHGYLDRKHREDIMFASQHKDDDDAAVEDDDQYRDPATGGWLPVEDKLL